MACLPLGRQRRVSVVATKAAIYRTSNSEDVTATTTTSGGAAPKRRPTVLLVEDEQGIRSLERRLLERQGFEVLEAANGSEALTLASASENGAIDLLVTDWYMPVMTGMEVIEKVRLKHLSIPALLVSGYADDAAVQANNMPERMGFLQKPFTLNSLAEAVDALLKAG